VADQIGLTHRGLQLFLSGGAPRASTIRKLREWYVRRAVETGQLSEQTALAALAVLLDGLTARARDRAATDLVDVIRRAYVATEQEPPDWVVKLLG
jgi:hypothetical protein